MSDILEKIKKLQVLAERGLDGERENAEKMVEILMKKHGISTVDLEEEKENYYLFAYNGKTERQLLIQVSND
ncbi:DUF2786 domain-containing protein [Sinanaerobacter sp. ZZT-01]|uniref:DUF2786 domain-containing protein n=1 Tax=Sinanaerobacter sp. ZZT-01 TaxID=3111540 RepID=UPI002D783E02|nr:DUF2786 domain-containing protein [Sinanaerobacter sp. ZZT-01]WRR94198.1 DUF2786 domain-containing protein [Sinanaerobacter sp. ZZT-01]